MKKVLLFVGGALVGAYGICYVMVHNSLDEHAETLYEDENMKIKQAGVPTFGYNSAVVYYKH